MKTSTDLPNLCILPTNDLLPHEDHDPRRVKKLSERIWNEGLLKHPPIVTAAPEKDQYIILDGTNRCLALAHLGIPHIAAQLISYGDPGVEVDTWYHVVCNIPEQTFETAILDNPGLSLVPGSLETARTALNLEQACGYIVTSSEVRMVSKTDQTCKNVNLLRSLVDSYRGKADIYRASNDTWEKQVPYYPNIVAIIVFPRLLPVDILDAVQKGEQIPSGLTRHIIPNRAVNINIPLHVLASNWSKDQKSQWLKEWLMEKMANNGVRFYSEPTFSFDE